MKPSIMELINKNKFDQLNRVVIEASTTKDEMTDNLFLRSDTIKELPFHLRNEFMLLFFKKYKKLPDFDFS